MKINISIAKLTPATIKRLKSMGTIVFAGITSLIIVLGISKVISIKVSGIQEKKTTYATLEVEKESVKRTIEQKNDVLSKYEVVTSKHLSQDDFINFMGRSSELSNVSIKTLKSGEVKQSGVISSMNFTFELIGDVEDIRVLIGAIDGLGTTYNIKNISIRKDGSFKWLTRAFDAKEQSWLQFESSGMPQQNIPLPQALPEIVLDEKGEIVEIRDPRLVSTDDLLSGNKYSVYMDINFLIAE